MKRFIDLNKKTSIIILLLVFSISFIFLGFAKYEKSNSLVGDEAYYHLNAAESIQKNGIPLYDSSLSENQRYYFNLIDYILSFMQNKIAFMMLIPFLLGISSLILFYFIFSEFNINEKQIFFSGILLILSPPFIYTFSSYTMYPFLVFFNLLFLFFYIKNMKILSFLAIIPTIFISLPSVFLTLIILFFVYQFNIKDKKEILILASSISLISIAVYFIYYFSSFVPNNMFFFHRNIFTRLISGFGANVGVSIFHLVLAFIGLLVIKTKEKRFPNYIVLFSSLLLSVFFNLILIFFNFFICLLASYALFEIYNKKWEIDVLKNITLILIVYGLLFSSFSFQTRLLNSSPTSEEISALTYLKDQPNGVVLSHFSNGYQIEYFSKKQVILDQRIYTLSDGVEKLNESNTLFYSRNLENTKSLLQKNNVSYIFINEEMKDGEIWDRRNQGLLFILDKSNDFQKIYDKNNVEIWKVLTI